jgi:HK97 family phage prohead protease
MMENKVRRAFTFAPDSSTEHNIHGMAAVYGQQVSISGFFNEVIERGAFDKTDLRDVLFLINHDTNRIALARSRRNNPSSTMRIMPTERGLEIAANVDMENNSEAQALVSAIKRGDIDGMSMIFVVGVEEWEGLDTETPLRRIKEIKKVYEVSAVNWPAYDETGIAARGDLAQVCADRLALEKAKSVAIQALVSVRKRKILLIERSNDPC